MTPHPFADAHFHSTASDGLLAPEECVQRLLKQGLRGAALTDHDTIYGWKAFREEANRHGLQVLPGAELSCRWKGRGLHLLAYGFNPEQSSLLAFLAHQRQLRLKRAQQISDAIERRLGHRMNQDVINRPGVVCRSHIARLLVECGVVETMNEAFSRIPELRDDEAGIPWLPLRTVLALVNKAGGIPVLAHPGDSLSYANVVHLKTQGLKGLEVWHPSHSEQTQRLLRVWTRNLGLLATGGSDTHGFSKQGSDAVETSFGCCGMDEVSWKALAASA